MFINTWFLILYDKSIISFIIFLLFPPLHHSIFLFLFHIIYMKTFTLCSATIRLPILRNFFLYSFLFCPRVGNAAFWERAEENKSPLTYLGTIFFWNTFHKGKWNEIEGKWNGVRGQLFLCSILPGLKKTV